MPVVPVALNSGLFWGRRKYQAAGHDRGRSPAADPARPDRETFMATLRERIEGATDRLVADAKRLS